jgi:hypothetical protein
MGALGKIGSAVDEGLVNSAGLQRITAVELFGQAGTGVGGGFLMLCDRLSHQGGLSAIVAGDQVTNLPTAPLTRHVSGVGVLMGLEIYTQIGTVATTVVVEYTDADGIPQQSTTTVFGGAQYREGRRLVSLPLDPTSRGVRSVESVNLTASTTTAGNFGVTLFKPILFVPLAGTLPSIQDSFIGGGSMIPEVMDNACLFWCAITPTTTLASFAGVVEIGEE